MLSMVNEAGLRLAGTVDLAERAATLVWTFIATPLRDAPEWLVDLSGHQTQTRGLVNSAGLTHWRWSRRNEQECLALHWAHTALSAWAAQPPPSNSYAKEATVWLSQAGLGVKALSEIVEPLVKPVPTTGWMVPQPWHFREQYQKLWRGLQSLGDMVAAVAPTLIDLMAPQRHEMIQSVTVSCRQELDTAPQGGVRRIQAILRQVNLELIALECQTVDREEKLQAQLESALAQAELLSQQMEFLLASWPAGNWPAWLPFLLLPWRWPGLAVQYWQMHQLGQQLAALYQQQAQLEHQRLIAAVLTETYVDLQRRIERLESEVDEIGDMLRYLYQKLPAGDKLEASKLLSFYDRFVDTPGLETAAAAAAIGGLGRHLPKVDDTILSPLLAAGRERMQGINALNAVDILSLLHEETASLSSWLVSSWADAAPLCQFDEASLSEPLRNQPTELTLIAAKHVESLRHQAEGAATDSWRWLELADPECVLILRLRSGIPVSK